MPKRLFMMARQIIGILLVLFFFPINIPLFRMFMESRGMEPFGEFQFLGISLTMFIAGCLMIFTPPVLEFHSEPKSP